MQVYNWDGQRAYKRGDVVMYSVYYYRALNDISAPWVMDNATPHDDRSNWVSIVNPNYSGNEIMGADGSFLSTYKYPMAGVAALGLGYLAYRHWKK